MRGGALEEGRCLGDPASPSLPVPEARFSSLLLQVPELHVHRPQGQRHAAQRHLLHPRALQHLLQPRKHPVPRQVRPAHRRPRAALPLSMPARPGVLQGFELVDVPGECCKKCQQTQCIVINQPGSQSVVLKVHMPVLPRPGQG